jgi:hypothetical protein
VVGHPNSRGVQLFFFPPLLLGAAPGRAKGEVCATGGLGLSAFGLRFSLLVRCSRLATVRLLGYLNLARRHSPGRSI